MIRCRKCFFSQQSGTGAESSNGSSGSGESDTDTADVTTDYDIIPNDVGTIQEMFPQVNRDQAILLMSLLHGNVHKVVSVCLKGLHVRNILRVFKSSRMLTRLNKVTVNSTTLLRDGLSFYKSPTLNLAKPIEVEIADSEAIDLGGPRRQFFCTLIEGLARNERLRLFEKNHDDSYLLPAVNHDAIICGHFKMLGRIIVHSVLQEGPAFPLLPPPVYYYLVHGTLEAAMPYMDINYLPARAKVIVDKVGLS